jgi:tRNA uridine 5-carbamoylmethylation protein Kti12
MVTSTAQYQAEQLDNKFEGLEDKVNKIIKGANNNLKEIAKAFSNRIKSLKVDNK